VEVVVDFDGYQFIIMDEPSVERCRAPETGGPTANFRSNDLVIAKTTATYEFFKKL
jgi:hypothetical protein